MKQKTPGERTSVLAPELMARVRSIQIRTHRLVSGALQGAYRSNFRGTGIEFEEVRPYLPGDDVRSIDWNVTARTGEPFIKTYVEDRSLVLQLLVGPLGLIPECAQNAAAIDGYTEPKALREPVADAPADAGEPLESLE